MSQKNIKTTPINKMKNLNSLYSVTMAALLAALCAPALAINKCIQADGRMVFQDAACTGKGEKINVRPASGNGTPVPPDASPAINAGDKPKTEAQRIETQIADSQRQRRRQELEVRLVPDAMTEITRQHRLCEQEIKVLQNKKSYAKNNLAGATWEASISSEMSAVATRCDTRDRQFRDDLRSLQKECRLLDGCK